MSKSKKFKFQKDFEYLISSVIVVAVLLLSIFNLQNSNSSTKPFEDVLGAEITNNEKFWQDFVGKHPDYIDGWLELGRVDKVREIDPNYFKSN